MNTWAAEMVDEVVIAEDLGIDPATTAPQVGDRQTIRCRIERDARLIRDQDGEVTDTETVIYTDQPLPAEFKLWLPEDDPQEVAEGRDPVAVSRPDDLDGDDTMRTIEL